MVSDLFCRLKGKAVSSPFLKGLLSLYDAFVHTCVQYYCTSSYYASYAALLWIRTRPAAAAQGLVLLAVCALSSSLDPVSPLTPEQKFPDVEKEEEEGGGCSRSSQPATGASPDSPLLLPMRVLCVPKCLSPSPVSLHVWVQEERSSQK